MTSLSVAVIPKIVAFIFLISLTRAAAGSCLSYGHSCWGGHGKRSISLRHLLNPLNPEKRGNDWLYSKLINFLREKPIESPSLHKESHLFEKFMRNDRSFPEPPEDINPRNQDNFNRENNNIEETSEVMDEDSQMYTPEEEYFMWNLKQRPYQKTGKIKRSDRIILQE